MNIPNTDNKISLNSAVESVSIKPKVRYLVDDFLMLKQSLVDGLGVAVMPEYMCKHEIEKGELITILPDWSMASVDMYALYPRYRAKIPKVKAFLEFIDVVFAEKLSR